MRGELTGIILYWWQIGDWELVTKLRGEGKGWGPTPSPRTVILSARAAVCRIDWDRQLRRLSFRWDGSPADGACSAARPGLAAGSYRASSWYLVRNPLGICNWQTRRKWNPKGSTTHAGQSADLFSRPQCILGSSMHDSAVQGLSWGLAQSGFEKRGPEAGSSKLD